VQESREIHQCTFVDRPNRFLGLVELNGEIIEVFVPNPGRMHELMIPGKRVYVRTASHANRRTKFDMIGMKHDGVLVSIDSYLPNRFMKNLLQNGDFEPFKEYSSIIAEPSVYEGRFDFQLENETGIAFIEVKSCTLVEEGCAKFPDAPTTRGVRHLNSLAKAKTEGLAERCAAVFVIQRPDAEYFVPNDGTDPAFGKALRKSHSLGVEVYALSCRVEDWNLKLVESIPVVL